MMMDGKRGFPTRIQATQELKCGHAAITHIAYYTGSVREQVLSSKRPVVPYRSYMYTQMYIY